MFIVKSPELRALPSWSVFKSAKPPFIEVDIRLTLTATPSASAADTTVSSDLWSSCALIFTSPAAFIVELSTSAVTLLSKVPLVTATAPPNDAANVFSENVRLTDATPPSAFISELFLAYTSTAPL